VILITMLACALLAAACTSAGSGVPHPTARGEPGDVFTFEPGLEVTILQDDLAVPWDLAFTPDGRMLVTEREGRITVFASADPGAELLGSVEIADALRLGEGGGLGIAIDRDFATFPFAYVCATRDFDGADGPMPAENQLLQYRIGSGADVVLEGVILGGMRAHEHHDGCAVEMDAEGRIWLTMGDANTARTDNLAQDPSSLNGKVLRINRDGSIPDDNPVMPGTAEPSAVYSMGHRNPQGIALRPDGLVMEAEHGTDRDDEVNHIVPGGNYGYACWSASDTIGPAQEQEGPAKDGCGPAADYLPAAWASGLPTIATSGATFLTGSAWGNWEGDLVVSTLKESDLRLFEVVEGGATATQAAVLLNGEFGRLRAATIGPDGALYLTTSNEIDDLVLRVVRL
jgi:glucose/arabinose dehydrogenase